MAESKNKKITVRLTDGILRKCESAMALSGCGVRNDFITRAIDFYAGYISMQKNVDFMAQVIVESVSGTVKSSENRLARLLFKIAVEMAKLEQMLATINDMDEETLRRLHIRCVNDVKKINGIISMEDAVKFQRGE